MGRIRTIKPSFFRHEMLQDLEKDNPGYHIMLVFAGLWTVCDSKGRFEYKPRSLKLDILPFLDFNLIRTLDILVQQGFIYLYKVDGVTYGCIPTWEEHQRITGKEKESGEKYPEPPVKSVVNQQGNNGETPDQSQGKHPDVQEGKGYIGKEEGMDIGCSLEKVNREPPEPNWYKNLKKNEDSKSGEEVLGPVKKSRKKALMNAVAPHAFKDSEFFDFDKFEKEFIGTDYEKADMKYYYSRILNWSDSNITKNKRTNWIAVARNFMLGDATECKLKMKDGSVGVTFQNQKVKTEFGKV